MHRLLDKAGVGIVAVVLVMAALSLFGAAIASMVATGQVSRVNALVREQAFYNVQAGIEYALKRIAEGTNPNGETKNLAGGSFSIVYDNTTGASTISSNISSFFNSAAPSFRLTMPTLGTMADCLTINGSGAFRASSNTELRGITFQNTCQEAIVIDRMTISWSPAASERMTRIQIGGTTVFSNVTGVLSGTNVDISNWSQGPCSTGALTSIRFNTDMSRKNFNILFTLSDGSTKLAFVQFVASDESACLGVNASSAFVGGTGFVDLQGVTLSNLCAAPTEITIDRMTVSWLPTSPTRVLNQIVIGGTTAWSGTAARGVEVNITNRNIAAASSVAQTRLRFSSDMRGFNYTVIYKMLDGTTQSVPYDLYETAMENCLTVGTSGTSIGGLSSRDLLGQTWQNTCARRIVIDRVLTNWVSLLPSRTWQQLLVNGATIWSGSASSSTTVDVTNVDIPGVTTFGVNRYRFNSSMTGRCFTHTIFMWDGRKVLVPSYCPP